MTIELHQFPYMSDNYGVLLHHVETGRTACIDAGDSAAYQHALRSRGWSLDEIWITHHHDDHVAGLNDFKGVTGAKVFGPQLNGTDQAVSEGDQMQIGDVSVNVIATPGHTLDMLNYHIPAENLLFSGDTLFTMGCGRLFEGTPSQMWDSLSKLMQLPDETQVYGSHEYTTANAKFALAVDPSNAALQARADAVRALRENGEPTVPSLLADEKRTNPFLRPHEPDIRKGLGMENSTDAEVFAELRRRKDSF